MDLKDLREPAGIRAAERRCCFPEPSIPTCGTAGRTRRRQEIRKAVEIAQAADFVDEKPDGDRIRPIAQGGSNVSGGQKQRLSIARAVARQPEIYIFDDSFSALDFQTDARLQERP